MFSRPVPTVLLLIQLTVWIGPLRSQTFSEARLPLPEDPVTLPSEQEVARHIATVREATLKSLQHDEDGWDDLWLMVQRAHAKDYTPPKSRVADTDGDGFSDYEEMLVHRNATYREPVYTKEEQIALIREERRQAIRTLAAEKTRWERELENARPQLRELIPPGQYASASDLRAAEVETAALRRQAELARQLAPARERALDTLAWKLGVPRVIKKPDGRSLYPLRGIRRRAVVYGLAGHAVRSGSGSGRGLAHPTELFPAGLFSMAVLRLPHRTGPLRPGPDTGHVGN